MIIAVGGQTRNVGKTTVVESIIRAFPERNWTAMKITQHGHGVCSEVGVPCDCSDTDPEHPFAIDEEIAPSSTDSGRFFAGGAKRAYWLRTAQGELAYGLPVFRKIADEAENLIVESNSLIGFLRPALYLTVVDYSIADFKDSAQRLLDRADAVVVVESPVSKPNWFGIPAALIQGKRQFRVPRPGFFSEELRAFVAFALNADRGSVAELLAADEPLINADQKPETGLGD